MQTLDYEIINFDSYEDKYGSLVPIESNLSLPFTIKRVYYIYDVESDVRRGFHAHKNLKQLLVCVKGSAKVLIKTPFDEKEIILDNPTKGLYIGPMMWREMYTFTNDAVLLVFANDYYKVKDYIREYNKYEALAKNFFNMEKK